VPEHLCAGVADQSQLILVRRLDALHQGGEGVTAAVRRVFAALDTVDLGYGIVDAAGVEGLVECLTVVFDREAASVGFAEDRAADLVGSEPVNGGLDFRRDGDDAVLTGFGLGAAGEGFVLPVVIGSIQLQKLRGAESQVALRRAATIRNILIRDVDLPNRVIYLRHTKNKKAQVIPLCDALCAVLREYLRIRGGGDDDFLFPNESGTQLTENGLRCSIANYNNSRGIQKTSIHLFRHTFARKYLVDCGGNAFTLQRLLGHSTLDMTKHYCAIFDADIAKNYEKFSPLAQMQANSTKIKMNAARR